MRWTVTSPDHLVDLTVDLSEDGRLTYRIARRGVDVVSASRLGIQLTDHAFDTGLTAVGGETRGVIDEWYEMPHGKRRKLHNHANSRVLRFANPSGRRMDLEIRAYSDGAAFRYVLLPESQNGRKETVVSELTTVRPAGPGRAGRGSNPPSRRRCTDRRTRTFTPTACRSEPSPAATPGTCRRRST